ncbi:MAG: secondary thiamine-phosphate synthase enzyme YjbQ, partial [Chloroflexota bacterium]
MDTLHRVAGRDAPPAAPVAGAGLDNPRDIRLDIRLDMPAGEAPDDETDLVEIGDVARSPARGLMRVLTRISSVSTTRPMEFVDVTDHVARCIAEAGIVDGSATVFSRHTTACIRINEHEPLLLEDMVAQLERLVPTDAAYRHDDYSVRTVNLTENERVNGHSHCRSLLLGASETVPVAGGRLLLGRWQRIFLVELDGPAQRQFVVQA